MGPFKIAAGALILPASTLLSGTHAFYGGAISTEIIPAIENCDAMLFLCPNYNDAVSANIMALFNRLTNLLTQRDLYDKYLFGIVVSGYSGSDLVAQQLMGAMCFNKTTMLPPRFCLMQTAHDPDSAKTCPTFKNVSRLLLPIWSLFCLGVA